MGSLGDPLTRQVSLSIPTDSKIARDQLGILLIDADAGAGAGSGFEIVNGEDLGDSVARLSRWKTL